MPALIMGGILGGSALMAGGSVAGGLLGQAPFSMGDQILPSLNPANNLELAATNFDALNQLGFGDIANLPSPSQQLVSQIQGLSIDEKTKRRGLIALQQALAGEEPDFKLAPFLDAVLTRVGVSRDDLGTLMDRDTQFREQQAALGDLSGIQTETVLERARAARAASQLLGGAASAATGGELSSLQQRIRDSLSRNLDDAEERALLQGRFGGFNPSETLEGIADARGELDLRAIEQSLLLASGLTQGLNGGLGAAQNSAQLSTGANQGALGIAAQQAQAANQLQQMNAINNADSLANGVAGGLGTIGNSLSTLGVMGGMGMLSSRAPAAGGAGNYIGGGTADQRINSMFSSQGFANAGFRP